MRFFVLLLFLALPGQAQRLLPVTTPPTLEQLAKEEGRPFALNTNGSIAVTSIPTINTVTGETTYTMANANLNSTTVPIGKQLVLTSASISLGQAAEGLFFVGTQGATTDGASYPAYPYGQFPPFLQKGLNTIPMAGTLKYMQRSVVGQLTAVTLPFSTTSTNWSMRYATSVNGMLLANSANPSAQLVIDGIGDSILFGIGATTESTTLATQLQTYYARKGPSVRYRDNCISGSTSFQHTKVMLSGGYNQRPAKLVFILLGRNDLGGTAPAVTAANILALVKHFLAVYPGVKIVVSAIMPINDVTLDASATATSNAIRSELTTYASTIGTVVNPAYTTQNNGILYFISDTRTAWEFNDTTKTTDGTHLNDAGQVAAFVPIKAFFDQYLPVLN